jgi:hypothetical protein
MPADPHCRIEPYLDQAAPLRGAAGLTHGLAGGGEPAPVTLATGIGVYC